MLRGKRHILLILTLLSAYAYFFPRWGDWNQNSRLDVVLAIVDQGTLSIDSYVENTGDYALYNGRYYGEKAPGTSFLGVPLYLLFKLTFGKPLTEAVLPALAASSTVTDSLAEGGRGLLPDSTYFALALYFVTFFTVAIPSALLGGLLYHFLGYFTDDVKLRLFVVIVYGLGTIAFPYSGAYYGHQVTAILLFSSFWLLFRIKRGELDTKLLIVAGFLLGYSVITEYPTVFVAGALFLYAVHFLADKRQASLMVAGGIPPVLALMLYNTAIFGKPWEFSYKYSELWIDYHHSGFFGTGLPDLKALWGITFSPYRGLFFLSPVLLLALPGFYYIWKGKRYRVEATLSLGIATIVLLFNASSKMWFGGHSVGPRYLIPMLPFLIWPMIVFLERHWGKRWWRVATVALAAVSIIFVWMETISGQSFPQYSPRPLFDYSWPRLVAGDIARNLGTILGLPKWFSVLPLFVFVAALIAILAWSTDNAKMTTGSQLTTEANYGV